MRLLYAPALSLPEDDVGELAVVSSDVRLNPVIPSVEQMLRVVRGRDVSDDLPAAPDFLSHRKLRIVVEFGLSFYAEDGGEFGELRLEQLREAPLPRIARDKPVFLYDLVREHFAKLAEDDPAADLERDRRARERFGLLSLHDVGPHSSTEDSGVTIVPSSCPSIQTIAFVPSG